MSIGGPVHVVLLSVSFVTARTSIKRIVGWSADGFLRLNHSYETISYK